MSQLTEQLAVPPAPPADRRRRRRPPTRRAPPRRAARRPRPRRRAARPAPGSADSSFGAVYFPWLRVRDPLAGEIIDVPPSGHVAGIWARTDGDPRRPQGAGQRDRARRARPHLAPDRRRAGRAQPGRASTRSASSPREGIRVWGARTLAADASEWRYLNVRRLFNMIEESIVEQHALDRVRAQRPRSCGSQIRRDVGAFLTALWRDGALFGRTPEEAFFVKCDEETNPPEVIDAGQVVAVDRHRAGQARRVHHLPHLPVPGRRRDRVRGDHQCLTSPLPPRRPPARARSRPVSGRTTSSSWCRAWPRPTSPSAPASARGSTPITLPGGRPTQVAPHPGPVDFAEVTLRYGLTSSRQLWDWFITAMTGNGQRQNVSIVRARPRRGDAAGAVGPDPGVGHRVARRPPRRAVRRDRHRDRLPRVRGSRPGLTDATVERLRRRGARAAPAGASGHRGGDRSAAGGAAGGGRAARPLGGEGPRRRAAPPRTGDVGGRPAPPGTANDPTRRLGHAPDGVGGRDRRRLATGIAPTGLGLGRRPWRSGGGTATSALGTARQLRRSRWAAVARLRRSAPPTTALGHDADRSCRRRTRARPRALDRGSVVGHDRPPIPPRSTCRRRRDERRDAGRDVDDGHRGGRVDRRGLALVGRVRTRRWDDVAVGRRHRGRSPTSTFADRPGATPWPTSLRRRRHRRRRITLAEDATSGRRPAAPAPADDTGAPGRADPGGTRVGRHARRPQPGRTARRTCDGPTCPAQAHERAPGMPRRTPRRPSAPRARRTRPGRSHRPAGRRARWPGRPRPPVPTPRSTLRRSTAAGRTCPSRRMTIGRPSRASTARPPSGCAASTRAGGDGARRLPRRGHRGADPLPAQPGEPRGAPHRGAAPGDLGGRDAHRRRPGRRPAGRHRRRAHRAGARPAVRHVAARRQWRARPARCRPATRRPALPSIDVRDLTLPLWRLAENAADRRGGFGGPPLVRFVWGKAWNVLGVIAAVAERVEQFGPDGNPHRSWLRVRCSAGRASRPSRPSSTPAAPGRDRRGDGGRGGRRRRHRRGGRGVAVRGRGRRAPDVVAARVFGRPWLWRLIATANDRRSADHAPRHVLTDPARPADSADVRRRWRRDDPLPSRRGCRSCSTARRWRRRRRRRCSASRWRSGPTSRTRSSSVFAAAAVHGLRPGRRAAASRSTGTPCRCSSAWSSPVEHVSAPTRPGRRACAATTSPARAARAVRRSPCTKAGRLGRWPRSAPAPPG